MAITAAGVGSGLDIENIISQLMTLERRPLLAIQDKVKAADAEVSSLGSFKSQLSTFQDAMQELSTLDAFRKFNTTSSDDEVLTATANGDAAAGVYNFDVERLAQNFKQGSKEFAAGATVGGNAGDSLTLTVDGESATIDLSTAMTVDELRDAVNSSFDNPGVTATVLNFGDGVQRLIMTAEESGFQKSFELSYSGSVSAATFDFETLNKDSLGATLTDLTQLDAVFSIDGYALTGAGNRVSDVVDGLTFELKGVGSATINLERDDAAIEESARKFVDAYNTLRSEIQALENKNFSNTSLTRSVSSALRDALNIGADGLSEGFSALSQVGIKTNAKTGELEFNSKEFGDALNTDFTGVAQLFANDDQGVAFRFDALIDRFLDTKTGPVETRIDSLNERKDGLQDKEADLERRLELKEISLRSQYAALDRLVGSLQSTSGFLMQNLYG
ncbi:MAG: flagellar filament capping protein FliD [Sedimenticolaceae bacterium]